MESGRRRLRLGIVGGGLRGNIGKSHRTGALMDGRWDIVAGALSRDREVARRSAEAWIIPPDRTYYSFEEMALAESQRADQIDAVTICTTNESHYETACAFMDHGFHVICDKPLTTSIAKAEDLVKRACEAKVIFAVTHNYSAYPMIRMARDLVASGELGSIRSIAVEYVSQYQSELGAGDDWQNDPARSGPLGAIAGTGTHAHHLAEFVSGLHVVELSADMASLVEGHRLDDHASVHLRFSNGARGSLWCTTIAPGNENGLRLRLFGSRGGLEWSQEHPDCMKFTRINEQPRILTRGGFQVSQGATAVTRVPAGHPEGYLETFGNLYSEIADAVWAHDMTGKEPRSFSFPTVGDGARGVRFMFAVLESSRANGRFVKIEPDENGFR